MREPRMPGSGVVIGAVFGMALVVVVLAMTIHPAEVVTTGQKSVSDQFGKNTVSVVCADSRAEDGGPSPCALIQVVDPDVTRQNTRFTARLVSDTELKVVVHTTDTSGERTREWSYGYATDQNGRGVDLPRISEIRFVRAGWAVTVDWIAVEK